MPTAHFDGQDHGPIAATVRVVAWPDQVIDTLGHDPRSSYVERFWLPRLGPSTTFLLRHLANELDAAPAGVDLDLVEVATRLGLGHNRGRHSPFARSLTRLVQFDLAEAQGQGVLAVRRNVPPLSLRQVRLLTPALQAEHRRWQENQLRRSPAQEREVRAHRLAMTLVELGEDRPATVRQLLDWKFQPAVAERAAAWASDRHQARNLDERSPAPEGRPTVTPLGVGPAPREASRSNLGTPSVPAEDHSSRIVDTPPRTSPWLKAMLQIDPSRRPPGPPARDL